MLPRSPHFHLHPNCMVLEQGKMASVAIYNHLALKHGGRLTADAAREALALYDEVVADAKAHPGSHPNIDLLFKVSLSVGFLAAGIAC